MKFCILNLFMIQQKGTVKIFIYKKSKRLCRKICINSFLKEIEIKSCADSQLT